MPSVAEELEALRNQGVTKKNASKLQGASGLSTPETEENSIKAEQERLRIGNYGKEAEGNLKAYNEARIAVKGGEKPGGIQEAEATSSVPSSSSTTAPAVATDTPVVNTAKPDDDDDDVPALEEIPDLEEMPTMDGTDIAGATTAGAPGAVITPPRDINRAERKARRVMDKLNMKKVSGITQCILKMRNGAGGARGGAFTITAPDCYVTSNGSSYIIFGEARQSPQDGGGVPNAGAGSASTGTQQAQAIQQLAALAKQGGGGVPGVDAAAAANDSLKIEELNDDGDEEVIDESGLDQKDIDLVISQAGCSRSKAVTALKGNDGDLVNAIMSLTA
mmetsp:Transcript_36424/g.39507  ORF Transcript_36424/g.39507 Transcript_36424/m.39507 type:complete len:334 (-) Transcript_36424:133-1134(-)